MLDFCLKQYFVVSKKFNLFCYKKQITPDGQDYNMCWNFLKDCFTYFSALFASNNEQTSILKNLFLAFQHDFVGFQNEVMSITSPQLFVFTFHLYGDLMLDIIKELVNKHSGVQSHINVFEDSTHQLPPNKNIEIDEKNLWWQSCTTQDNQLSKIYLSFFHNCLFIKDIVHKLKTNLSSTKWLKNVKINMEIAND